MSVLRDSHADWEQRWRGNLRLKLVLVLIGGLVAALIAPSVASAGETYAIQDLGVLPGNVNSLGYAINDSGWTAGSSNPSIGYETAFLNNGATMTALVDPWSATPLTDAYGINSSDEVVGNAVVDAAGGARHAFLYNGTSWTDLGSLAGRKGGSWAYAINNNGVVVGESNVSTKSYAVHGVLWDSSGRIHDLGTLPGDFYSDALGVNSLGQVVGWSSPQNQTQASHAFYYDGTSMRNIGTLGGVGAEASSINDYGHIVGTAQTPSGQWDAFMYVDGSWNDLGPGEATAINSHDQVVGDTDSDVNGAQGLGGHPFLYQDGFTVDLNSLIPQDSGWVLRTARGINDAGQIVGTGVFDGEYHAYRLVLTLLGRWAPKLIYDNQEGYKADSAAEITDNYQPTYTNTLYDGNNAPLAAADPSDPSDTLSLSYLTFPDYPSGIPVSSADHIDEADSYAVDVQRLEALPQYANEMYGRVVPEPGGQYELQYWFFEYLNSKTFYGFGQHEGDWEMIQVHLDENGNPIGAAYAQHTGGEVCPWSNVQKTEDGRPIVYVAQGSHASYYTSGSHDLTGYGLPGFYDTNDGAGAEITPDVIDVTNPPQWISSWPGLWGGSTSGIDTSPHSPGQQGQKWNDPLGWEVGQGSNCTAPVQGAMRASTHGTPRTSVGGVHGAESPPLPKLTATISGRRVRIRYRFKSFPRAQTRRPWQLITTVVSANKKYPPLTVQTQIRGRRTGLVSQPLGLGHGPYRFLFSVRSPLGTRSRTVNLALH